MPVATAPRVVQNFWIEFLLTAFSGTEKMKLFQNDIAITPGLVLGDLTEANFTGYAEETLADTWVAGLDVVGKGVLAYPTNVNFTQTGVASTNIIYGWYIVNFAETGLLAVGRFDEPIVMDLDGNELLVKAIQLFLAESNVHSELLMGS